MQYQAKMADDNIDHDLRRAAERLGTVLELSSEWYWEQDENYRFTMLVGAGLEQTGLHAQQYVGKTRWDYDAVAVSDDGSWDRHKALLEARQPFADFVFRRFDRNGEMQYISTSGQPVFDRERFVGYRGIAKDVTSVQRAEQLLRLEHMVARSVASADSASAALKSVLKSICETQAWECGRYFGWNEEAGTLKMEEFWHVPSAALERFIEQSRGISYTPAVGLMGEAFESAKPLWVMDIEKDSRIRKGVARDAGMHGTFLFPVMAEGKPIGMLSFHSQKVREPDDRLLDAVGMIGSQIGQFLSRKQGEERIRYLAAHDALTSLPNRMTFSNLLNMAIQTARRYERAFAVLFIDLDGFKSINDSLGHDAGDELLQEIANRFADSIRESDVVARLGGDEFAVLLQEAGDEDQVAAVARKILSAASRSFVIGGQQCRVTASVGICMYPAGGQDEQTLMKNADLAMYFAKAEGKNTFQFYSPNIKVHSAERLQIETGLRRALEQEQFFLHYQAKLDFSTGRITGVEALLRWRHPDLGVLLPSRFIPMAEETGLIMPIGRWVLQTACKQNVAWQREGLPPLCVAVNLSTRQFADEALVKDVVAALACSGMRADLLELEMTENMVMHNRSRAGKMITALKALGVRIAIADFGIGYSALAQIKRFPIDTLKVDRSFINDLAGNDENKAITQAIIAMGKTLSLTVVAEGVETQAQQVFLADHACDEMQGYYFSRPIAHAEFADFLRKHVVTPR